MKILKLQNKLNEKLLIVDRFKFILNEKKYAERMIKNNSFILPKKYYHYMVLIAKYISDTETLTKEELAAKMIEYLKQHGENITDPEKVCNQIADKYYKPGKTQLTEIDEIPITRAEIKKINEIDNLPDLNGADKKALQRLLFCILVFGKWQNLKNPHNEKCWCNFNSYELLTAARVSKTKINLLGRLYNLGYIIHQEALDGDNCYTTIIDNNSPTRYRITDLRELGYLWNRIHGDMFVNCSSCGLIIKTNSAHEGMCKNCFATKDKVIEKCVDCGIFFFKGNRAGIKKRCDYCQSVRNRIANGKKHKVIPFENPPKTA